jgi:hypothetical protein
VQDWPDELLLDVAELLLDASVLLEDELFELFELFELLELLPETVLSPKHSVASTSSSSLYATPRVS